MENRKSVEEKIKERVLNGYIKDVKQATKTIVDSLFSNIIIWLFLKNKEISNINKDLYITNHKKRVPNYNSLFTIMVDNETQKPDMDIALYSLNKDNSLKKCIILSLKTSLRERAGQTYKWKLLMEIANSDSTIKEKYNIS